MEDKDNMEEAYDMDTGEELYPSFSSGRKFMGMSKSMGDMESDSEDLDGVELEEEFNLDELLAELEGLDEEESTEENLNEAEGDEEESDEEEMSDEDMEAETLDLENMTDEDLKKFIEDVITDMVQAGELEAGEDMKGGEEMEDEEIVDIDELLAEASHDKNMKEKAKKGMKEELEEAYATIQKLTQDINEINLLNAKLLYTNKIFKASALTESQKVKVLSSMDKATNVKEVKLVYESLSENLKPKKAPIKENLNFASKSAGVAPRVAQSNPILDPAMVARFKKIAGI